MIAWSDPGVSPDIRAPLWPPSTALDARDLVAVIDEDARTAAKLGGLLRDVGLRVLTFTCPATAGAALRSSEIDLVVVPYPSAHLDALGLTPLASNGRARRRPKVVLLADDPTDIDASARALADAVGRRGCPAELFDAIHRARGLRALGRRRPTTIIN